MLHFKLFLGSSDKVQCEPKICDNSSDSKRDTNGGRKTWNSPAGRIRDLDFSDSLTLVTSDGGMYNFQCDKRCSR